MADKFLNLTAVQTIKTWAKGLFATGADLSTLSDRVDDIIAEGGEPNIIETVKVNNTALVPDSSKAVNVTVPTAVSDLTNDGDGSSRFATEDYVTQNGGKIDVIQVNGVAQTITNKIVNIIVPTLLSQLTNDSEYLDATAVQALIKAAIAQVTQFDYEIVTTLPATGQKGIIYLVSQDGTGAPYDEWIWVTPQGGTPYYEPLGDTTIDLTGYWTSETGQANTLEAATVAEINAILNA